VIARRRRPAAAAVELALVLPLLALFVAMIVDYARVLHATQVLDSAADDAAAYATKTAVNPSATDPGTTAACAAGAALNPPLRADQVTITTSGGMTTVTVVYDFPLILSFLSPGGVSLQRTVCRATTPQAGD